MKQEIRCRTVLGTTAGPSSLNGDAFTRYFVGGSDSGTHAPHDRVAEVHNLLSCVSVRLNRIEVESVQIYRQFDVNVGRTSTSNAK
jgi:hypothetical protein